ncbi:MAG: hypothetical protein DRR11_12795 [Gammaproteobacteria bacterium]|nr:MAG: hypothetical protein DRR11_12795 [Gammaproteobacteria bacterium]RLA34896.1 MAG: hypothetical protein DRR15_08405 [Gammaproteobacteria bacterium]
MNARIKNLIGIIVLSISGTSVVNAAPTENPVTGHWYEVFPGNSMTWDDAKTAAGLKFHLGVQGHLATITSSGEDAFIETVRAAARVAGTITRNEIWVDGIQPCTGGPGSCPAVGEGWIWENLEGAISTPQVPLPSFSNWLAGEPNDNTGAGSENHLAIGLRGTSVVGWNDEGALGNIGGYIVEYDVPRVAEDCSVSEGGCETVEGHELTFPEGSIPTGAKISFNAFEFADDPARCGLSPLVIFGTDTDPSDEMPELIIPPYLCGSPDFVVIAVDSSDLNILEGTVFVENDTPTVLPDNDILVCEDPIFQDFPTEGDPQFQDVVVWQSTEPTEMLEVDPSVGGVGQFAGAAGEFTNECGSSRARVRGASYYVVGLSINFGPGYEWSSSTAANFGKFVELTRYKLTLLQQSLVNAKSDGALKNGDYTKMKQQLKNAVKKLDRGNYSGSLAHVNKFLKFVNKANYTIIAERNHNGEHLMRGSNIEFMLRVKVIPYAQ